MIVTHLQCDTNSVNFCLGFTGYEMPSLEGNQNSIPLKRKILDRHYPRLESSHNVFESKGTSAYSFRQNLTNSFRAHANFFDSSTSRNEDSLPPPQNGEQFYHDELKSTNLLMGELAPNGYVQHLNSDYTPSASIGTKPHFKDESSLFDQKFPSFSIANSRNMRMNLQKGSHLDFRQKSSQGIIHTYIQYQTPQLKIPFYMLNIHLR